MTAASDFPPPLPPPLPVRAARGPWGFWATLLWGFILMKLLNATQATIASVLATGTVALAKERGQAVPSVDEIVAFIECPSLLGGACVLLPALWLVIRLRHGLRFADYLALRRFPVWQLAAWSALSIVIWATAFHLAALSGDQSGKISNAKLAANSAPLLVIIFTHDFLAPVSEELLFRGFLFRGIAASRAGWIAAILIPNLLWVEGHPQYDAPVLAALFVIGCVYGLARHLSGSVLLPILLHMAQNGLVTYATFFLRESG